MKKNYFEQFQECKINKFTIPEFVTFKEHPELIPPPYKKSVIKMIENIKTGKLKGITLYQCGKFNNGRCCSSNVECRKLRGYDK